MKNKTSIAQVIFLVFVVALGIEIGAGLYETIVIVPLWAGAAPDSVIGYVRHNTANPQFVVNSGGRFWIFATSTVGLLSVATLLTSRATRREHRRWRIAAAALVFAVVAVTFAWFVPNILLLQSEKVLAMNPEEVARLADRWVALNWARVCVYVAAWVAALRALVVPAGDFPQ